jgi:hypothetical protein
MVAACLLGYPGFTLSSLRLEPPNSQLPQFHSVGVLQSLIYFRLLFPAKVAVCLFHEIGKPFA